MDQWVGPTLCISLIPGTEQCCLDHAVQGDSFDFYDCADPAFTSAVKNLRTKELQVYGFTQQPVFYEQEIVQARVLIERMACLKELDVKFSSVPQLISFLHNRSSVPENMQQVFLVLCSPHDAFRRQEMDGEALTKAVSDFLTTTFRRHAECEATLHALSIARRFIDVSNMGDYYSLPSQTFLVKRSSRAACF